MPTYGYKCPECSCVCERKMTFAEYDVLKDKQKCETCEDVTLIRVISAPVVHFAGGGWYDQGYGITQMEMDSNLESEKRLEETANQMRYEDKKNGV